MWQTQITFLLAVLLSSSRVTNAFLVRHSPVTKNLVNGCRGNVFLTYLSSSSDNKAKPKGFAKTKPKKASVSDSAEKDISNSKGIADEVKMQQADSITDTPLNPIADAYVKAATWERTVKKRKIDEKDQRVEAILKAEEELEKNPNAAVVPEIVAQRMATRMFTFGGVPVFLGMFGFVAFYVLAKKYDITIQPAKVAYATQLPFLLGLVGLTYGIFSASWDLDNEGSALGAEEFKTNVSRMYDGLMRSSDRVEYRNEIQKKKGGGGKKRRR